MQKNQKTVETVAFPLLLCYNRKRRKPSCSADAPDGIFVLSRYFMQNAAYELSREKSDELMLLHTDGGDFPPHFHRHVELYYVESGEATVTINDETRTLKRGELSFAAPYDVHTYERISPGNAYILVVPPVYLDGFLKATKGKTVAAHFLDSSDYTEKIARAFAELEREKGTEDLLCQGLIDCILGYALRALTLTAKSKGNDPDFVSAVFRYLSDHLKEEVSLAALAAAFGYSRCHFSRLFNENFHTNLAGVLAVLRTREALAKTEEGVPLSVAAKEAGFSSMRTFHRAFRSLYHTTYGNYKKAISEGE